MMLDFRPHHLLCILGMDGTGPSQAYVDSCRDLLAHLEGPQGKRVPIKIVFGIDAVCSSCPGRHRGSCEHGEALGRIDALYAEILDVKEGDVLPWGDLKKRLIAKIADPRFDSGSALCPWPDHGGCSRALRQLREPSKGLTASTEKIPVRRG